MLLDCLIIFSTFLLIGMIIAIVFIPRYIYHGPNSDIETKKKYYDNKTGKCYKYGIRLHPCNKTWANVLFE